VAHDPEAFDVVAGLLVAELGGQRQSADDLELGLGELGGALLDALLKDLVRVVLDDGGRSDPADGACERADRDCQIARAGTTA
jgi:hypothetical protein